MKRIALIITLTLLVVMTGCRGKKAVITTPEEVVPEVVTESQEKILFDRMLAAQGSWNTLVAKGSVSLGSLSSSFEMRMIYGESIQISLRPIFGIEIARVVMNCDSVFLYDKINKRYIAEGIATFSDKIPFEPTIGDLQNALLGRPFLLGQASLSEEDYDRFVIEMAGSDWLMQPRELPRDISYIFAMNGIRLIGTLAQHRLSQHELRCDYGNYDTFSEQELPSTLLLTAKGKEKSYSLRIDYSSMKWNEAVSIEKLSTKGMNITTLSKVVDSLMK